MAASRPYFHEAMQVRLLAIVLLTMVGPVLVVIADRLHPPPVEDRHPVTNASIYGGTSMVQNNSSSSPRSTNAPSPVEGAADKQTTDDALPERLDADPLSAHPARGPSADDNTDDGDAIAMDDRYEQLLTANADMVHRTLGPAAFWLKYVASQNELVAIRAAEAVQHSLDIVTRNLMVEKDALRHQHEVTTAALSELRDKQLDAIPQYWSRRWAATSPIFWQELYWARRASQETVVSPAEWAPDTWRFLPIDDEAFLMRGLSSLRCNVKHFSDDWIGIGPVDYAVVTVRFQFNDAPGVVYPFNERELFRSMPLSLAQRFATGGAATDDSHQIGRKHRSLGDGSTISFRPEYVEASRSNQRDTSMPTSELNLPPPNSFFALFAPSVYYEGLPDHLWVQVQSRLGQLVLDACQVTLRCCDDDVLGDEGGGGNGAASTANEHSMLYDQWEAQVAADAAAWEQHRGVDEL